MIHREWTVSTSCWIELVRDNDRVFEGKRERLVPAGLASYVPDNEYPYDLEICFTSRGYYQSMSMYGGPDQCGWPEEGDDERTLDCMIVYVHKDTGKIATALPKELADELFEFFREDVDHQELPERDDDDY